MIPAGLSRGRPLRRLVILRHGGRRYVKRVEGPRGRRVGQKGRKLGFGGSYRPQLD